MASIETTIQQASEDGLIPGAVLVATNKSGSFSYEACFGVQDFGKPEAKPLTKDAIFLIASCTKLLTAVAVAKCVENGQISLDDDVVSLVPELAAQKVLTGFDKDDKPVLIDRSNRITLRNLLTHSSGLAYDAMHPDLMKYRQQRGEQQYYAVPSFSTRYLHPLVFQPNTSYYYGPGADWAGRVVEVLNRCTLEEFMDKHIWNPLGITDMAFFVESGRRDDMVAKLMGVSARVPGRGAKVMPFGGNKFFLNQGMKECCGGVGLFASAPSYLKVLSSLLRDDGILLGHEMREELFRPSLTSAAQEGLTQLLKNEPERTSLRALVPEGTTSNWAIGGMTMMESVEGWRGAGTLAWGGLPNLKWFIDRENGLCGLFATQVIPPDDKTCEELAIEFEKAMYQRMAMQGPNI